MYFLKRTLIQLLVKIFQAIHDNIGWNKEWEMIENVLETVDLSYSFTDRSHFQHLLKP